MVSPPITRSEAHRPTALPDRLIVAIAESQVVPTPGAHGIWLTVDHIHGAGCGMLAGEHKPPCLCTLWSGPSPLPTVKSSPVLADGGYRR